MATQRDRILEYLRTRPDGADDDVIAAALGIPQRQAVNQICRALAAQGQVVRVPGPGGKIVNRLHDSPAGSPAPHSPAGSLAPPTSVPAPVQAERVVAPRPLVPLPTEAVIRQFVYPGEVALTEDQVKAAVAAGLTADGWAVEVRWGHAPGIDIIARRGSDRWVLEAKGEGSLSAMRVNYFLGALGELLQRMDSPAAGYGLALPAHRQFAGLILRLPAWVRRQLALHFFLVRPVPGGGYEVGLIGPRDALPAELPSVGDNDAGHG